MYAVDVGYGQLAWSLRSDPRVVNLERTQRPVPHPEQVPEAIGLFLRGRVLYLPVVDPSGGAPPFGGTGPGGVPDQPQFEAGREKVGKKGVVRDPAVHREVIEKTLLMAQKEGYSVLGLTYSPVKGPEGNIEYLVYLQRSDAPTQDDALPTPAQVVEASHKELDR